MLGSFATLQDERRMEDSADYSLLGSSRTPRARSFIETSSGERAVTAPDGQRQVWLNLASHTHPSSSVGEDMWRVQASWRRTRGQVNELDHGQTAALGSYSGATTGARPFSADDTAACALTFEPLPAMALPEAFETLLKRLLALNHSNGTTSRPHPFDQRINDGHEPVASPQVRRSQRYSCNHKPTYTRCKEPPPEVGYGAALASLALFALRELLSSPTAHLVRSCGNTPGGWRITANRSRVCDRRGQDRQDAGGKARARGRKRSGSYLRWHGKKEDGYIGAATSAPWHETRDDMAEVSDAASLESEVSLATRFTTRQ